MGQPPSASLTSVAATKNATESHRQLRDIAPDCTIVFSTLQQFPGESQQKQKTQESERWQKVRRVSVLAFRVRVVHESVPRCLSPRCLSSESSPKRFAAWPFPICLSPRFAPVVCPRASHSGPPKCLSPRFAPALPFGIRSEQVRSVAVPQLSVPALRHPVVCPRRLSPASVSIVRLKDHPKCLSPGLWPQLFLLPLGSARRKEQLISVGTDFKLRVRRDLKHLKNWFVDNQSETVPVFDQCFFHFGFPCSPYPQSAYQIIVSGKFFSPRSLSTQPRPLFVPVPLRNCLEIASRFGRVRPWLIRELLSSNLPRLQMC